MKHLLWRGKKIVRSSLSKNRLKKYRLIHSIYKNLFELQESFWNNFFKIQKNIKKNQNFRTISTLGQQPFMIVYGSYLWYHLVIKLSRLFLSGPIESVLKLWFLKIDKKRINIDLFEFCIESICKESALKFVMLKFIEKWHWICRPGHWRT
jgi:hypothetical protein